MYNRILFVRHSTLQVSTPLVIEMSTHAIDIAVEFFVEMIVAVDVIRVTVVSGKDKRIKETPMSIMF